MYLPVLLTALAGLVLAEPALRFAWPRAKRRRARIQYRIEYYLGWSGCQHPVKLERRITREHAKALAATGGACSFPNISIPIIRTEDFSACGSRAAGASPCWNTTSAATARRMPASRFEGGRDGGPQPVIARHRVAR